MISHHLQLHLLHGLLVFDPAMRSTAQAALDHEYLNWPRARVGTQGAVFLETPAPHPLSMIDIESAPSAKMSLPELMVGELALLKAASIG